MFLLSSALISACQSDKGKTETNRTYYKEQHRPQYHFSPEANWMNDPNGMVYYEGEYHLFYQYYPDSTVWGPMHWAHAVSTDLVHWEHLPIALYPDSLGYIFSGSAVVDWENASGFGKGGKPPLIAIFSYHDMEKEKAGDDEYQYQGIAYSNDKGRTWTKYEGNPVVPNPGHIRNFRDPKVFHDKKHGQWVMPLATDDHLYFYGSKDFKKWEYLSEWGADWGLHGGVWECPDLFSLSMDDEGTRKDYMVLIQNMSPGGPHGGSCTQYFIGQWDGKTFVIDPEFAKSVEKKEGKEQGVWLDHGRDNYAGVTWSDIPSEDGRRIWLGWMSNWLYAQKVPTEKWRSAMTIPRFLTLNNTPAGLRLALHPVSEIYKLRGKKFVWTPTDFTGKINLTKETGVKTEQCHILAEFEPNAGAEVRIVLENTKGERYAIGYEAATKRYFSDRQEAGNADFYPDFNTKIYAAPHEAVQGKISMELFIDRSSCELFADVGLINMTETFFPSEDFSTLYFEVQKGGLNGPARVVVSEMKGIW